jgi:hypothetical protein
LFEDLVAKNKGDRVAAYKQWSTMTAKGDGLAPGADKYLDNLYKRLVELETAPVVTDSQKSAILKIKSDIAKITGGQSGGKIVTMADIRTTAASRGMTEKQVMDAAKAQGYIIQ